MMLRLQCIMLYFVLLGLHVVLVNAQFSHSPDSWIDLMKTKTPSIALDAEKVQAFGLQPVNNLNCERNAGLENERCGEPCVCINDRTYCCRQRRDWDALSHWEKTRFLTVVYDVATGRSGWGRRDQYMQLLYIHEQNWVSAIHNKTEFFPWHRIYLLHMENLLRSVDCRITIPYWDWTKKPAEWWLSSIFSQHYFGSNIDYWTGRLTDRPQCPSNGFFSAQSGFTDLQYRCLVREFSYDVSPPSFQRIQRILSWKKPWRFENALRHEHGVPHYVVGGEGTGLFFSNRSAEDPLFWLHHANVDYQWYQRQTRYLQTRFEVWGERDVINGWLTAFRETIGHAINPFRQGIYGTCVEYVEFDDRYEEMLKEMRTKSKIGSLYSDDRKAECRKSIHSFPAQIFTLFRTSAFDMVEFLRNRNSNGDC